MIDWHTNEQHKSQMSPAGHFIMCVFRDSTHIEAYKKSNLTPLAPPECHTKITVWAVWPHGVYLTAAGAAFLLSASHTWADRTMWLNQKINTSEVSYCVSVNHYSPLSEVTRLMNAHKVYCISIQSQSNIIIFCIQVTW